MRRFVVVICCLLWGMGWFGRVEGQAAEVFLEATRTDFQKIPIWILGFGDGNSTSGQGRRIGEQVAAILKADLNRSQIFSVVDRPIQPIEFQEGGCQEEVRVAQARESGVPISTWGRVGRKNVDLVMDACAFDEGSDEPVTGKRYIGKPITMKLLRQMVHRWADALVFQYTGEPGIARTKIAYVSEIGGNREISVMDYDGYGSQRVTDDRFLNLMPTWSADRKTLVYTSYRDHNQALVQLTLANGNKKTLVHPQGMNITPALSPDGAFLAYGSAQEGNSEIFTLNLQTQEITQLTFHRSADLSPAWSPNGREIAFTSDRGGGPQIYIMGADGSNVRRLTFDGDYNAAPAWSPRGDWIAYVCQIPKQGFKLCRISPDGRERQQITSGTRSQMDDSPSWSPDGRHIVFSSTRDGHSHIYMVNEDGTDLEQLTKGKGHNSSPVWSPF